LRESDALAKSFATKFYTADIHRGALAMPRIVTKSLSLNK
jgi:spermidine synthase